MLILLILTSCSLPIRSDPIAKNTVAGPPAEFSLTLPRLKVYGRPLIKTETDDLDSCRRFRKRIIKELVDGYLQHEATECVEIDRRVSPL